MHPHRKAKFHKVILRDLTEQEIAQLMLKATSGRLATIGEDGPYVVPMSFTFYDNHIYFHCHHDGKKLANIKQDPRVCFQFDISTADTLNYSSVIIQGKAKQVTDNKEAIGAMTAMDKKYAQSGAETKPMPTTAPLAKMIKVFKIIDPTLSSKFSETYDNKTNIPTA